MSYKTEETVYFKETSEGNTDVTLKLAKERAEKLGIKTIVVASTRGMTGVQASEFFEGYNVVVVSHHTGYKGADVQELTSENWEKIEASGGKVLVAGHVFGGVGRAVRRKFKTYQVDEVIAATLKVFGPGTKVCAEIVLMAADAGVISIQEDVIAIGGTGRGADTALVMRPVNAFDFFNLKIREVICKPLL
ncbi:MAG: pyruvate kinase alpha/beta domain-containing protein [Candidatus Bathyarchaeia archaeon]